jgi:hypothetical protein
MTAYDLAEWQKLQIRLKDMGFTLILISPESYSDARIRVWPDGYPERHIDFQGDLSLEKWLDGVDFCRKQSAMGAKD